MLASVGKTRCSAVKYAYSDPLTFFTLYDGYKLISRAIKSHYNGYQGTRNRRKQIEHWRDKELTFVTTRVPSKVGPLERGWTVSVLSKQLLELSETTTVEPRCNGCQGTIYFICYRWILAFAKNDFKKMIWRDQDFITIIDGFPLILGPL